MKTLISIAASVALFAVPATAQRMGHSNTNAPTVGHSLNLAEKGSVELSYTSITWARGTWAAQLADEATRGQKRVEINAAAKTAPLPVDVVALDNDVADVDAYAIDDPPIFWDLGIPLRHGPLHIGSEIHGVHDAAKLH